MSYCSSNWAQHVLVLQNTKVKIKKVVISTQTDRGWCLRLLFVVSWKHFCFLYPIRIHNMSCSAFRNCNFCININITGRRMRSGVPVVVLRVEHKRRKMSRPQGFLLSELLYKLDTLNLYTVKTSDRVRTTPVVHSQWSQSMTLSLTVCPHARPYLNTHAKHQSSVLKGIWVEMRIFNYKFLYGSFISFLFPGKTTVFVVLLLF